MKRNLFIGIVGFICLVLFFFSYSFEFNSGKKYFLKNEKSYDELLKVVLSDDTYDQIKLVNKESDVIEVKSFKKGREMTLPQSYFQNVKDIMDDLEIGDIYKGEEAVMFFFKNETLKGIAFFYMQQDDTSDWKGMYIDRISKNWFYFEPGGRF